MEGEIHRYFVVGSEYIGNERFVKVDAIIVAHSTEEAEYFAFRKYIIPSKIKQIPTSTKDLEAAVQKITGFSPISPL